MVKSYLKYEHSKTFGLISSAASNILWAHAGATTARSTGAGTAIVGAGEEIICWDIKKGELLNRWRDSACGAEVCAIARSTADEDLVAVGYQDGSIRIWDSRLATVIVSFNGHKSAISVLAFDQSGVRLASGSQDTDIIIWDLIAEVGLFKLRGHKNQITGLEFLRPKLQESSQKQDGEDSQMSDVLHLNGNSEAGFIITTSKDALIKIWDLSSQHCIETHVAQLNGECWSLGLSPNGDGCITAGNDGELKVWSIDTKTLNDLSRYAADGMKRKILHERGTLFRQGSGRTIGVKFHPEAEYIAAYGSEKSVELWRIRSEAEVEKSLARKRKRRREKTKEEGTVSKDLLEDEKQEDISTASISEILVPYSIVRTTGKVRSIDWMTLRTAKKLQLLISTTNNQLEVFDIDKRTKSDNQAPDYTRTFGVDMPGHRTDVRSLSLSSDERMLASSSDGLLKVWNLTTSSCIRTLECGYALCSAFLPGDKICVVGTKNGELQVFDIASSTLIETVQAHEKSIFSLHVHPDGGRSMVTGSADGTCKFWNFEIVQEEIPGTRRTTPRLKLVHTRTLKMTDEVLCLRFSPDGRLLAISLLDNTVKVFFVDTLKLFLNLYGHKLPVISLDIAYDSKLIVTCSADKNVRLWGLDFGDNHHTFFAHHDTVMQVAFVPHNQDGNGHHFFSCSKDRAIKYWDGDKFQLIDQLKGHHGEVRALAVSRTGQFIVSASQDKGMRVWKETDEQIFLEEQREKELEELYETTLATSLSKDDDEMDPNAPKPETRPAGKQTTETLMAGERIAEALEIGIEDLRLMSDWRAQKASQPSVGPPQRNIIFLAYGNKSAEQHVLDVVEKVKAAALQDALLVLSLDKVTTLFTFLAIWAKRQWNVRLTCRILFFLLKTHHKQIVASKTMRPMLDSIRTNLRESLQGKKDEMGLILAALKFTEAKVKDQKTKEYVDEEIWNEKNSQSLKKRPFVHVA